MTCDDVMVTFENTRIVVYDLETTEDDYVCELGLVEVRDGIVQRSASRLFGGGSVGRCQAIHGISDEERAGLPPFTSLAREIASFMFPALLQGKKRDDTILMGHNILKFDNPLVFRCLREAKVGILDEVEVASIDTYQMARTHIMSDARDLKVLCSMFNLPYGSHRGEGDSYSAWNLFLKICLEAQLKTHVKEMVKWQTV